MISTASLRRRTALAAVGLLAGFAGDPDSASSQTPVAARLVTASLSADTIELGDSFELTVVVEIPEGGVLYVPDSVPNTGAIENLRGLITTLERGEAGVRRVTLTYSLIAFQTGRIPVPRLILSTETAEAAGGSPDEVVRSASLVADPERADDVVQTFVDSYALFVASGLALEDVVEGLTPRPANDVVGANWNWLAVVLALGALVAVLAVATSLAQDWYSSRPTPAGPARDPVEVARDNALSELDRLKGLELPAQGRVDELYAGSSDAVRGFVEHLDPDWGPDQTTTELMASLVEARSESPPDLVHEMRGAEVVKFGRSRPDEPAADRFWSTLRGWVSRGGPDREADS